MHLRKPGVLAILCCVASVLLGNAAASADEVKVMISGGFASAYRELGPEFEETAGDSLLTIWGPETDTVASAIPVRLVRGEWTDVLILAQPSFDDQVSAGKIVPGSKVDLARSGIGMAVQEGAPVPDVSTVDALRRTLLAAKSIVYPDDANGAYIRKELFRRIGVEGLVESKSRMIRSDRVASAVASGEAELGFQQVVELLPVDGVTVIGTLPAELQRYTVFSGGIAVNAKNPAGAQALIQYLSSPDAGPAIEGSGLEPLTPRQPGLEPLTPRQTTVEPPTAPPNPQ